MKYNAERKLIEQTIDCNVLELLERYDTILAGGALTSVFTNNDINDLDIYFKNQRDLVSILYEIFLGDFPLVVTNMTNRSIMLHDPTTKFELDYENNKYSGSTLDCERITSMTVIGYDSVEDIQEELFNSDSTVEVVITSKNNIETILVEKEDIAYKSVSYILCENQDNYRLELSKY